MKNSGIKLTFKDDFKIDLFFNSECTLTIDDVVSYTFSVSEDNELQIKQDLTMKLDKKIALDLSIVEVEEVEFEENKESKEALKTCINCNGRRYCMSGGCANTPCGWICG